MQEDSPGRNTKRSRNERYETPPQAKRLSSSSSRQIAGQKAKAYAAKDNKSTRVLAKQAILQELNTHLFIRAQGLVRKDSQKGDKSENVPDNEKRTAPADIKGQGRKETRTISRIPRRVEKTQASDRKTLKQLPATKVKQRGIQQETLATDMNNERFQQTRIRFLAEKYATLWKRKTYGRMDPVVARTHYERYLKWYTLQIWQDIWWSGRKGWKLNIRADYHNRYRLWLKAWKAWKVYMNYRRLKRTKGTLAVQQAQHTLVMKCWTGWRNHVRVKRTKQQQNKKAKLLAEKHLKRRVWGFWLSQLAFKQQLQELDNEALQFWAFNLMSKAWNVWSSAWCAKNDEMLKMVVASRFANSKLMLNVWRGFKNYRAVRKLKLLQQGAANRHFVETLLRKSLHIWVVRWQRQVELAQFNDLILYKGDVAMARRAFLHWKHYIAVKHRRKEQQIESDHHYILHLLRTCFNALQLQAVQRRLKEMRSKMAADACRRFQLQRFWNVWLKHCEHSEELKLHSVSRKARVHHSFSVKRKVFSCWVKYFQWRRFRKSQYAKADYHFSQHALPRYFCNMMVFVDFVRLKRENQHTAAKFRREALLAKMFYKWWSKYQLLMDVGVMERMAILHHDEVVKQHFFRFWLQRARDELRERKLEIVADQHYSRQLLLTGISRWKEFNRENKESRSVHRISIRHYYTSLLRKIWLSWTQFVYGRQVKWRKQARADIHYHQKLLTCILNKWKSYHKHVQDVHLRIEKRVAQHNLTRLRFTFQTWQQNVVENREERKNKHVAKRFLHQTLLFKCFSCWREYAIHRGVKKYEQSQRLGEIQHHLDKGKLRRSFRAWKSFTRKSLRDKGLDDRADVHRNKQLLHKTFDTWKRYIHLCFRIKILQRQSMWLHNQRITAAFFRRWKAQYNISVQDKRMTILALWHWSMNLRSKAFFALMEYAISRKRKALRVAKALDQRRNRLLRTGVTQWMKVGFHLAAERARFAQTRQLEAAYSVHQCVYRCAMHWRRITAKRVQQRGGKPKARPVSTVKPDWPDNITSVLPTRPLPAEVTPEFTRDVDRILTEPFKERPKPRRPDYLRDSYDVGQISMVTVSSRPTLTTAAIQSSNDEAKPRSSPPLPVNQLRDNIHPHQRNQGEDSIVFPSSSGEDSFVGQNRTKTTGHDPSGSTNVEIFGDKQSLVPTTTTTIMKPVHTSAAVPVVLKSKNQVTQRRPVLLPPSSFSLPARTKRVPPFHPSFPLREEVRASGSTLPASTPRTSLDSQKHMVSSPSSADSSPSRGSERVADEEKLEEENGDALSEEDKEDDSIEEEKKEEDEEETFEETKEDESGMVLSQMQQKGNLQERILYMKSTLQEFHDLKINYSHKKLQRDQLLTWVRDQREELGADHEDEELLETEQCLHDLTEEVHRLAERMKQSRPIVEQVAANIRELIEKAGLS